MMEIPFMDDKTESRAQVVFLSTISLKAPAMQHGLQGMCTIILPRQSFFGMYLRTAHLTKVGYSSFSKCEPKSQQSGGSHAEGW